MGLLTLGLALTGRETGAGSPLGRKKVRSLETGLEYKHWYRKTAPLGVYQKIVSLDWELREMGVLWLGIVISNVWCSKVSALTGRTFLLVAPEGVTRGRPGCAPIKRGAGPGDKECW